MCRIPPPTWADVNGENRFVSWKGKLYVIYINFSFVCFYFQRRDLVNTAILTSRQVSEPLRIFMVTQAGKVADVTLQASCSSADESVLKVRIRFSLL